ncbi:hypothetical protein D3C86_1855430 [compost metagenome]
MLIQFFADFTHGINTERVFALFRFQRVVIRVRTRLHQLTATTFAAAFTTFRLLTHQKTGHSINQSIVAHAG